jgi:hypothetical protein
MKRLIFGLLSNLALAGCVTVNTVSVSPVPKERGTRVTADDSQWSILGFIFSDDYVDNATRDLVEKCGNARVEGILFKSVKNVYPLVVRHTIEARGFCVKG